MAHIAVLAQYYYPAFKAGGPIPGVRNAIKSLVGHSTRVFAGDRDLGDTKPFDEPFARRAVVDDAEVVYLPRFSPRTIGTWLWCASQLRRSDVVYINSMFSPFFSVVPLIFLQLVRYGGKIALAPRGELASSAIALGRSGHKKLWLRLFARLKMEQSIGRRENVVWLASSPVEKESIACMFPHARIVVSPETLRAYPSVASIAAKMPGDELELVCVGRLAPVKGTLDLVSGLEQVSVPVHLRLIGPAEDADYVGQLRKVEARLPVDVRVSWVGALEGEAVMDAFRTAHFSILLSHGENFGHAIGEALLAGCPVLISDQTPWSFVADRNAGVVLSAAECRDPERVAREIEALASITGSDWSEMSRAARRCGAAGLVFPGSVSLAEALEPLPRSTPTGPMRK